ncbi:MAG: porin, partial [Sulfuricurvum sp.]|nr:porin [Sulfuricurvum sp.]
NVATGDKSSVYTTLGSVYMDGEIAANPDTKAWKVGGSTKMVPGVTLLASYAQASVGNNGGTAAPFAGAATQNTDFTAWDLIAKTKAGPVDLTAIYTQFDKNVKATDTTDKTSDTFRLIAAFKF